MGSSAGHLLSSWVVVLSLAACGSASTDAGTAGGDASASAGDTNAVGGANGTGGAKPGDDLGGINPTTGSGTGGTGGTGGSGSGGSGEPSAEGGSLPGVGGAPIGGSSTASGGASHSTGGGIDGGTGSLAAGSGSDAAAGGEAGSDGGAGGHVEAPGGGGTAGTAGPAGGNDGAPGGAGAQPDLDTWPVINGIQWADTEGNPIQAHGGGVLKVGDDYYWFGENRNPDGTFYAVSAYRSRDLIHWEFRNHVLQMTSDPGLNPANVERPKVVYNASTQKYVMWMHWENGRDYGEARAAVASADSVDGDYAYHGSFRPLADSGVVDHDKPGYMSRDCTLFVDDDGSAYFISATNENYDLNLYRLTDDYLGIDHLVATLFEGGHREAPALFKRNGTYFLLTSGATGWDPNQGQYATSADLDRGWSSMRNIGDGTTFSSQSTFVLEVRGATETSYVYLGDRWAGAWGGPVNDSTYVWLPLTFSSATEMAMSWSNRLELDTVQGRVSGAMNTFRLLNEKSGLALSVEGASNENGANIVQLAATGDDYQEWRFNYDGAGHFRLTNIGSEKVLDVPDESSTDGVELIQWENHDGDNQGWRFVAIGGGEYRIRNKNSGRYVGIVSGAEAEGAAAEQRAETSGSEQVWIIEPVE